MSNHSYRGPVSELYSINATGSSYSYQRNNKNNEMNKPVNMSSTQESDKNVPVRQLPKKRKFFPSELDEIKPSNDLNCQKLNNTISKSPVTVVTQRPPFTAENARLQHSVVIIPPQSVAVDYSFRESESNTQSHIKYVDVGCNNRFVPHEDVGKSNDLESGKISCLTSNESKKTSILVNNSVYSSTEASVCIDLNEWKDHRVLAKQNGLYLPGVIRRASEVGEVWVDFDYCEGKTVKYSNIFTSGKFDIISNASPSKGQLTIGTNVCVRKDIKDLLTTNVFVEGNICSIINNPMCFVVRVNVNEEVTAKRADLRLLQPPWWDELTDLDNDHGNNVNLVIRGQGYQEESGYNNMMHGMIVPEQNGVPLQLNQVVPTLQAGSDYYRSTATSPLHLTTPVSHNSACTPLSNGSVDELRPPQYEDFCESDDDLRREDILFPSDPGKKAYYCPDNIKKYFNLII